MDNGEENVVLYHIGDGRAWSTKVRILVMTKLNLSLRVLLLLILFLSLLDLFLLHWQIGWLRRLVFSRTKRGRDF